MTSPLLKEAVRSDETLTDTEARSQQLLEFESHATAPRPVLRNDDVRLSPFDDAKQLLVLATCPSIFSACDETSMNSTPRQIGL